MIDARVDGVAGAQGELKGAAATSVSRDGVDDASLGVAAALSGVVELHDLRCAERRRPEAELVDLHTRELAGRPAAVRERPDLKRQRTWLDAKPCKLYGGK